MNAHRRIADHPLIGTTRIFRGDLPPYDPAADTEPGVLIVGNGMAVTVLAAFHDWNGVDGLDILYVQCHQTGESTHVTPSEVGWASPLVRA